MASLTKNNQKKMATKGTIEIKKVIGEGNKGAHLAVNTFANFVQQVMKRLPIYAINEEKLKKVILSSPSGGTALWDALIFTVNTIRRETAAGKLSRGMRKIVITFTDGQDTSSYGSFRKVCELLAHPGVPNINFYFLAVGSADVATMQMLARGKKHVHVIAECGGGEVSAECD